MAHADDDGTIRLPMSEFRADLATLMNRVAFGKEHIVVQRSGKDVAAVVPVEALAMLEAIENAYLVREAEKAFAEGGEPIPWEEFKRELDRKRDGE